jgi:hypothetical protein
MGHELDDILQHFGTKGMKWGVRKKKDAINSTDRTIKKGTTLQNISSRKFEVGKRHMYTSYTDYDNDSYTNLMGNVMYTKSFKNQMMIKKDIRVPSDKKLVENFKSLVKSNPKQVAKDMTDAYNDIHRFRKKTVKHFDKKLSKLDESYSRRGEKLTKEYVQLMVSDKAVKSRAQFFGGLIKKGYDGMSDINDREGGANDPLIIFKPERVIGKVKSVELTKDDLQRYWVKSVDDDVKKRHKDLSQIQRSSTTTK